MDNSIKIRWISRGLEFVCYGYLTYLGLLLIATTYDNIYRPENLSGYIASEALFYGERIRAAVWWRAVPATMVNFLPFSAAVYAYWRLSRLFVNFRKGNYFTENNAQHLFIFALLNFFGMSLAFFVFYVGDFIVTLGTDLDPQAFITIDGDEFPNFLAMGSFVVIAWILKEAVKVARENAEFV